MTGFVVFARNSVEFHLVCRAKDGWLANNISLLVSLEIEENKELSPVIFEHIVHPIIFQPQHADSGQGLVCRWLCNARWGLADRHGS
jgi:hypothetical protein